MSLTIQSHFYPAPDKPYLCFSQDNFPFFKEIFQIIEHEGLEIIEIGKRILTTRQEAHLIRNALLFIGAESWGISEARASGVPNICLTELSPPVYPEVVSNAILNKLGKEPVTFKTIRLGENYLQHSTDLVPDFLPSPGSFGEGKVTIRLDLNHNQENAAAILAQRKCAVASRLPVDPKFLAQFKDNIEVFSYLLDERRDLRFIDVLHRSGIKYKLISDLPERFYNELKFECFDFNQVWKLSIPDISVLEQVPSLRFKTNRWFFSKGKFYSSELFQDIEKLTPEILRDKRFARTADNFYFYTE